MSNEARVPSKYICNGGISIWYYRNRVLTITITKIKMTPILASTIYVYKGIWMLSPLLQQFPF